VCFPIQVTSHLTLISCGRSISIACWVVVFSPQIVENFRRGCADGLSIQFLIVWLVGDVFNILGAVVQRVLPTMVTSSCFNFLIPVMLMITSRSYLLYTIHLRMSCYWDNASTTRVLRGGMRSNCHPSLSWMIHQSERPYSTVMGTPHPILKEKGA
jgi:hypothetical protein